MNDPIQPTEIDKRFIEIRRRQAKLASSNRQTPSIQPVNDDFDRKLRISDSPAAAAPPAAAAAPPPPPSASRRQHKLYNPDRDPIPVKRSREYDDQPIKRTAEPERLSDAAERPRDSAAGSPRQLFDHRKDDPLRFAVRSQQQQRPNGRPTPTPKSSGDHFSASSASSYAPSIASSSFTLSSNTDGSSTPSAIFDRSAGTGSDETNVFAAQLKKLYRTITGLEAKIKAEDENAEEQENSRVLLKGKEQPDESTEREKWFRQLKMHKELVDTIHNLLEISLAPSGPTSLRNIPNKYNMNARLWTFGFHKLLESLRRSSFNSPIAFEHLQDFIYFAYTFYTGLLEEPQLNSFRSGWLEALGDLARYRWAVCAMVAGTYSHDSGLTQDAVRQAESVMSNPDSLAAPPDAAAAKSVSNAPVARIDDSPSPSVGVAAARNMDLEPEKERWRCIAREWYAAGLVDQPGTGKLHHHLGTLSRDADDEELRAVYHFVKSLTTLHPFQTSREAILSIWSIEAQAKRSQPDARASDIFVLLHGMLFTNIQLDDFQPTLSRFVERLEIEGAEEREWIMMAVVNIGSLLEYGKLNSVLKRTGGAGAIKVMAKRPGTLPDDDKMQVDEERPSIQPSSDFEQDPSEYPVAFTLALQLTFSVFSHVLHRPTRKASQFSHTNLNPYLTILLTFLSTVLKHPATLSALERSIPWDELASFLTTVPRNIMASQGLQVPSKEERWIMLTSNSAPPLPEDWCLRGMEWIGRKVYERGFWKSGEDRKPELELLDTPDRGELTDGRIEDDDEEEENAFEKSDIGRRWIRIVRSGVTIANTVNGFTWVQGTREWKVEGDLEKKVQQWKAEDMARKRQEERRRMGRRMTDELMDVDESDEDEDILDEDEDDSDDDENDSEQVKELRARRRYLKSLLRSDQPAPTQVSRRSRRAARPASPHHPLPIVAGYTILVLDTNILLSMLSMVSSLVESLCWTIIIPLPVIMELEGLSSSTTIQLGKAAQNAMDFISSRFRTHSTSLKVQTSKGNYLTSLGVRTEQIDFHGGNSQRNMDDLILQAAIWQDEHWVDRSVLLKAETTSKDTSNAVKVVLLTLDRNLRLKARSRQLSAAGQKDLADILSLKT